MEDLTPISPNEAAKELRRARKEAASTPKPNTPVETGLAIASLTIGVLVAISAIPAGMLLSANAAGVTLLSLVAFAAIATTTGAIGRRNAMGVAGMVLGIVALIETVSVFGYISFQEQLERQKVIAQEKEHTKQKEEEKRIQELKLAQQQSETEARIAEAKAKEAQLKIQQEQKNQERLKQMKEDELAAAEEQKQRQEQYRKIEQERKDREAKSAIEEQQAAILRIQMDRQRKEEIKKEGLVLIDKLQKAYPVALNDHQKNHNEVIRQREDASKNIEEVKSLQTRLNNVSLITQKLSHDDPQRSKMVSEENRLQKIINDKDRYPDVVQFRNYTLEPANDWRLIANNISLQPFTGNELRERYFQTGNRLAELHQALLGASLDYPEMADDINTLVKTGVSILCSNSKETIKRPSFGTSARSIRHY